MCYLMVVLEGFLLTRGNLKNKTNPLGEKVITDGWSIIRGILKNKTNPLGGKGCN